MTTPNQVTAPDGAFVVGGDWNYGQSMTAETAKSMFMVPTPTSLADAHDIVKMSLSRLPLDALKPWQSHLGATDEEFSSAGGAVDKIIASWADRPKLQDMLDGFVQGVTGLFQGGFQTAHVKDAAVTLAASISDLSALIAKMQQQESQGFYSGNAGYINFTEIADLSTLSGFTQTYSGTGDCTLGVSGGYAQVTGTASDRLCNAFFNDRQTLTDYQKIGMVFATTPSKDFFGGSRSANWILGRVNTGGDSMVYAKLLANEVELGCFVSGAQTTFATVSNTFKPGAVYWLECGTSGGVRIFRISENGRVLLTYTDFGTVSQIGHHRIGLAVSVYSDDRRPGKIAALAFFDNTPPTLRGSGWKMCRTSTTGSQLVTGENPFPASWFDTQVYLTDDLIYEPTNNQVAIAAPGWYLIQIAQTGGNTISIGSGRQAAALFVNNVKVQQAADVYSDGVSDFCGFDGTFIVYLVPGNTVQPGYVSTWPSGTNSLLKGEASGTKTFWSGAFLGNTKPS